MGIVSFFFYSLRHRIGKKEKNDGTFLYTFSLIFEAVSSCHNDDDDVAAVVAVVGVVPSMVLLEDLSFLD